MLPFYHAMTKRAFILLAVLLIVAAFYCFPGSRPPRPLGTVEFLGKCALIVIRSGTGRELGWFNVSLESKAGSHWVSSLSPWQLEGGPGALGRNDTVNIPKVQKEPKTEPGKAGCDGGDVEGTTS